MDARVPIVFVHGIRLSGACWGQQQRLISDRVTAAPDLPGHGSRRGERFAMDAAVEAVVRAIDDVGGSAVIVGHSLGGYVGMATAARHPDRVTAFVGAGCTLVPGTALRAAFRLAHQGLSQLPANGGELSARALTRVLPSEIAQPVIAAGIATEVIPDVTTSAATLDPVGDLASHPGRVVLLNGRHDHFRLQEKRFLKACRTGSLQVVPGAGHYLPLTHGETFARTVIDIANSVETAHSK